MSKHVRKGPVNRRKRFALEALACLVAATVIDTVLHATGVIK